VASGEWGRYWWQGIDDEASLGEASLPHQLLRWLGVRVRDYRDLVVWQRAVEFVAEVYRLSATFPRGEQFGLTAQLRRASVSVVANIAEGSGRVTSRDLMNFLSYARASLNEAESLVFVAQRLAFVLPEDCSQALRLANETSRMLAGLRVSIRKRARKSPG
jgi:four helix bundle protein